MFRWISDWGSPHSGGWGQNERPRLIVTLDQALASDPASGTGV